ncbi:DNA alkylation repair protein [Bacillus massilinigeriensis]|uniref:DNA alkylation repair protein n=1 Tax=Bacillus massilionigeriensis TaxID=1805475 RepID=UPI00096B4FBB
MTIICLADRRIALKNIDQLISIFEANRNEENAVPMSNYMKNNFPFLGIKKPERSQLMKQFFKESGILQQPFQEEFVRACWKKEEREYQYAAMDYMEKALKKLNKQHVPFIEQLITTKSWWDSVDILAPKLIGKISLESPEMINETINHWSKGENIWLKRSAILFQLKYKDKTNEERLYHYIRENSASTEFFIQKAMGWALREYSKTNPESVKQFISSLQLPKLTIREGSKYIS